MKKRTWETLARTAFAAAIIGSAACAHATTLPLQGAVITASYNGTAAMLGLDDAFSGSAGGNTTALDPLNASVEFLSADFAFAFDFAADGTLSIYNNSGAPLDPGAYSFRFDFGSTLAAPITAFKLLDGSAVGGLPLFSILDGGTALGLDLGALSWNGDFTPITASIEAAQAAAVPEPGSMAILLAGAGALALVRRRSSGSGNAAPRA
jgi:hypothetical protein